MRAFSWWSGARGSGILSFCAFLLSSVCTKETVEGTYSSSFYHEDKNAKWDDMHLEFLSNSNKSSLHQNDYHIVRLTLHSTKTSYMMHISKTEGLFHPIDLGRNEENVEDLQCLYSGIIHELTNDNRQSPKSGIVSLSSCHHQSGFEGLLLLPEDHFYIKPAANHDLLRVKRASSVKDAVTIPHKAHKVNSVGSPLKGQNLDDILLVPPEDLKKAQEFTSSTHLDSLDDEISSVENEMSTTLDMDDGPPLMMPLAKGRTKSGRKKKNQKDAIKYKARSSASSSSPTSSKKSTVRVVEIAVFTDAQLYKIWAKLYPTDTTKKMDQYILAVINNMNALYKQPSMTENISFRLVHVDIQTTQPRDMKNYECSANKYLSSFCNYAAERNQQGALWDHALMLTGCDLIDGGSSATAGLAWFSTMCINHYSCSLIEGSNFGSSFITAHEIGHSLGMDHDGSGRNTNCDAHSYIMSPTTGGGKLDWSKCSVKNMKDFVTNGYNYNPKPKCITKKGSRASSPIKFQSAYLPGQQFDASAQCKAMCEGCKPSKSKKYKDMCHLLACDKESYFYITTTGMHPALEGTTCASGKTQVCKQGKCQ